VAQFNHFDTSTSRKILRDTTDIPSENFRFLAIFGQVFRPTGSTNG
jgi:hypothetical protein